ncbi:MAG: tyrosine-type recombinase/integrase [Steroidobacteraceae bacterium]
MSKPLTAAAVAKYRPGPKRRIIRDGGARSLFLVIEPSGHRSWRMRFRTPTGRIAKVTLGSVDLSGRELKGDPAIGQPLSLQAARQLAATVHRERALGRDVAAEHKARRHRQRTEIEERSASTFGAAVRDYVNEFARPKTRNWRDTAKHLGLHYRDDTDTFDEAKGGLSQRWAERPVASIDDHDVWSVVDEARRLGIPGIGVRVEGIADSRGRAVFAALSAMFGWLKKQRRVKSNPCADLDRPSPGAPRDRVLAADEVRWLWKACDAIDAPFGPLLKLLLLTGQRRDEVAGMTAGELSDDGTTWTIGGSRTKNHRTHVVPLAPLARDLIASVKGEGNFVFSTTSTTPVSGWSRMKRRLDAAMLDAAKKERGKDAVITPWRLHDLRRTAVTGMVELGIAPHLVELIVNHVSGARAGVAGIYNKSEMLPKRRDALERWARYVGLIIDADLYAAHEAFLASGDEEAQKEARATFDAAIAEGGGTWAAYVEGLVAPRENVVAMPRKGRRK